MLITFSGLDGSGKTTLIEYLKNSLEKENRKVTVLTMYDHVSFYSFIRSIRNKSKDIIFKGNETDKIAPGEDMSVIVSDDPHNPKIGVSDKKGVFAKLFYGIVRSVLVKKIVLFLDLLVLLGFRLYFEIIRKNILITDRYLYDSLADVADLESKKWLFVKLYISIVPVPDVPVYVDIDPETAYSRKKEFPVKYMEWRRATYKKIFSWIDNSLIIFNDNLKKSQETLITAVKQKIEKH